MSHQSRFDADGHLLPGSSVESPAELVDLLSEWLMTSRADTIGDVGEFGRRAAVRIHFGGDGLAVLNSDTKRHAVREFLRNVAARGIDDSWTLVPNRNGRPNKFVFRRDKQPTAGWYCYLKRLPAA